MNPNKRSKTNPHAHTNFKKTMKKEEQEFPNFPDSQSHISKLPNSLIMDILSTLPITAIFNCKSVCKTWRNIILEPYFSNLYSKHGSTVLLLRSGYDNFRAPKNLSQIDVHDLRVHGSKINGISRPDFIVMNSCNGLVCLRERKFVNPVYIWNPILGEYVKLSKSDPKPENYPVYGIGYDPMGNKYKVLSLFMPSNNKKAPKAQIYTLGTRTWRNIGFAPCPIKSQFIFLHGVLHWIAENLDGEKLIYSLDIGMEIFRIIPSPPLSNLTFWLNLGVLQDCLYLSARNSTIFRPDVEIWVMEEYGKKESWVKKFSIKDPMVEWWDLDREFQVIRVFESGEMLVLIGEHVLSNYNPRDRSFTNLRLDSDFNVAAHSPGFVSLKDVLGENFEVFKVTN